MIRTSATVGIAVLAAFAISPLIGWPSLVRVAPVLLAGSLVLAVRARPWSWSATDWDRLDAWHPSERAVRIAALAVGCLVFWIVLTRFRSGDINAIDFTVYYDRPNFQTLLGRPLFVESGDDPLRAYRSYLAVHAHWIMLPMAAFYLIWASPLWLLAVSVLAVILGAVYTLRIVQWTGAGGPIAAASAVAFVFNDNTARTLIYGFHTEVLYAWFVPWAIFSAVRRRWPSFLLVGLLCIAVKEDAFLLLCAVAVTIVVVPGRALTPVEKFAILPAPIVVALANVAIYYRVLVPQLSATEAPFYANYWANYGPTVWAALLGMARRPLEVLGAALTSAFLTKVIVPHLYLPLIGWRWFVGIVPVVVLYGASINEQMRSFGIYYAIVLVPFLTLGAAAGARLLADHLGSHRARSRSVAAALLVTGSLVAGISNAGYSLRPWKPQVTAVPRVLATLASEPVVLVQSALYPHAGYDDRVRLLTAGALAEPRHAGAAVLLAPGMSGYPMSAAELDAVNEHPVVARTTEGLVVVRNVR